MAKKTAIEGVYISDKEDEMYQQMRSTLLYVVASFTSDRRWQVESLTAALAIVAKKAGMNKEDVLEAVGLVYDSVRKRINN